MRRMAYFVVGVVICASNSGCDLVGLQEVARRLDPRLEEFARLASEAMIESEEWRKLAKELEGEVDLDLERKMLRATLQGQIMMDFAKERILGGVGYLNNIVSITQLLKRLSLKRSPGFP